MPEVTLTSKLQPINDDPISVDDDRETMIKVDHVSMEFNMASEQLNSLKEYAIALVKRNLYFEKFTALDDISFEVKRGDVFGILGTNGSGKSTLLKIIAGVLEPTKGSCEINGNIAPLIELGAGFDMELSARENIYLNGSLLGYSKQFIDEHFDDIVDFAEIEKFLDMPMKNYSSGMIARIAFAIATVIVPEILIVDEVLSVGDFMFQQKCENRINELIEKHGVTVLIVSHSNDQIERLCNKAIWIEKGHERIIGDAAQVCNAYRVLGGRTGSVESEKIIFESLQRATKNRASFIEPKIYTGKNHYEIAANAILDNWRPEECESVFLVPDHTHVFSIAASGLAGALNAPILPFPSENIPAQIVNTLLTLNPDLIHIFAKKEQVESVRKLDPLSRIANRIVPIPCGKGCHGIRLASIKFGCDSNLWHNNTAAIIHFDDTLLSLITAPLCYSNSIPYFVMEKNEFDLEDDVLQFLKKASINRFIIFGSIGASSLPQKLTTRGFDVHVVCARDESPSYFQTLRWMNENGLITRKSTLIGSADLAKWQSLICVPSLAGRVKSSVVLEDVTNLDNVTSCLNCLSNNVKKLSFIGYQDILGVNTKLLSNA